MVKKNSDRDQFLNEDFPDEITAKGKLKPIL